MSAKPGCRGFRNHKRFVRGLAAVTAPRRGCTQPDGWRWAGQPASGASMPPRAPGTLQDPHAPSTWVVPSGTSSVPCLSSQPQPHAAHRPPPSQAPPMRPWPQPCLNLPGVSPRHGVGRGIRGAGAPWGGPAHGMGPVCVALGSRQQRRAGHAVIFLCLLHNLPAAPAEPCSACPPCGQSSAKWGPWGLSCDVGGGRGCGTTTWGQQRPWGSGAMGRHGEGSRRAGMGLRIGMGVRMGMNPTQGCGPAPARAAPMQTLAACPLGCGRHRGLLTR